MLRHYWISAWRTLLNGPFYALVNIGGLSIGLCVTLLCVLIVRSDYGYDHFLRGYADTYLCVSELMPSGQPPVYNELTNQALAVRLKLGYPSVRAVARLLAEQVTLGREETTYPEQIYWADPTLFEVLGLPVLAGDVATALQQPDSIVLTREAARRYFGREPALGQWLQLNRMHRLRVTAVIADLPSGQTELQSGIFASGVTAWSKLAALDARALPRNATSSGTRSASGGGARGFGVNVLTYLRMVPGSSIGRLQPQMPALMNSLWPNRPPGLGASIELLRLDRLHLFPGLSPGVESRVAIVSAVGLLVLLLACGNFVNLWSARLSRRAREVGVRKVAGAGRASLAVQFVGESLLQVILASAVALALAELLVPQVNALLGTTAVLDYWRAPLLLAAIATAALLLGIVTGLYPALILASLRPAGALRGLLSRSSAAVAVRQILTGAQFAALSGLIVAASVIYQQREYATHEALRRQTDQMLMIRSNCRPALLSELQRLPGVRGAACSGSALLDGQMFGNFRLKDGSTAAIDIVPAGPGLLALYGLEPVAGEFVSSADLAAQGESMTPSLILNAAAVRRLGYPSAVAAVGQSFEIPGSRQYGPRTGRIMGVAPDFSLDVTSAVLKPTIYMNEPQLDKLISVRLAGPQLPQTLAQIDRLWSAIDGNGPIERFFLDQHLQELYTRVLREDEILAIFSLLTLVVAALGLLGLAAAAAERATVEIGIRKAMGAGTAEMLQLLLWRFVQPVVWGSLAAWPLVALLMRHWLQGFVYHVDLQPWLFPAASAGVLLLSGATVSLHVWRFAQAPPADALRYE